MNDSYPHKKKQLHTNKANEKKTQIKTTSTIRSLDVCQTLRLFC